MPPRQKSIGDRCASRRTLQTEQLGDRQMLPRLRHRPVIRGDDEQQEIDAGGPGQHVVDQLLVAGDVDEAKCAAVGQGGVGVAEIERDPPRLLLRQAVGVDAGESFHQ